MQPTLLITTVFIGALLEIWLALSGAVLLLLNSHVG